jgi:ribonuclease III
MDFQVVLNKVKTDKSAEQKLQKFNELFTTFAGRINISTGNIGLYQQAFMHSSYINDLGLDKRYNNERLEFLGDAVLELMVSDHIFNKYEELPEGRLTKLRANIVCEPSLVVFASKLDMPKLILLGRGEDKTGGRDRPSIVSDAFEAFLGALYLDQGHQAAEQFLKDFVYPHITSEDYNAVIDYKTMLQEYAHQAFHESVTYELVSSKGPSHHRQFETEVSIGGRMYGKGMGLSKKESEQQAAKSALNALGQEV